MSGYSTDDSISEKEIQRARKVLTQAAPRSQQFKDAQDLLDEVEQRKKKQVRKSRSQRSSSVTSDRDNESKKSSRRQRSDSPNAKEIERKKTSRRQRSVSSDKETERKKTSRRQRSVSSDKETNRKNKTRRGRSDSAEDEKKGGDKKYKRVYTLESEDEQDAKKRGRSESPVKKNVKRKSSKRVVDSDSDDDHNRKTRKQPEKKMRKVQDVTSSEDDESEEKHRERRKKEDKTQKKDANTDTTEKRSDKISSTPSAVVETTGSPKTPLTEASLVQELTPGTPVVKNFAGLDTGKGDELNEIHYDAHIGGGYHLRFSTWKTNNRKYVSIRKGRSGANLDICYLSNLKEALLDLEETCSVMIVEELAKDKK